MQDIRLTFTLDQQEDSRLCWAAVTVALADYYNSDWSGSQIDFAKSLLGDRHNQFFAADKALHTLGLLQQSLDRPITIQEIYTELSNSRPIAACMKHFVGWHLVVIYGISNQRLLVADSLLGNSEWDYDEFLTAYQGYYHWSHSYTTHTPLFDAAL